MSSDLELPQFNLSVYQEYENDRWKFLQPTDQLGYSNVGYMIKSPYPVITFTVLYVLFVCCIGPIYMRNREPYKLKSIIRFYNLIMVILAASLLYRMFYAIESLGYMFDCNRVFTFEDQSGSKVYQMADFILMIRISEYLDTIFFTLRKKQNQITFLHVFHHAFVPLYAYWIIRTAPLRFNVYIILINSLIHVFMYFYYFIATFTEQQSSIIPWSVIRKILMLKKYMTLMQILQFVSLAFYAVWPLFTQNRCNVPNTYIAANIMLAMGFLILFCHFYALAYRTRAAAIAIRRQQ